MKHLSGDQKNALFGPEDHEAPIAKGKHTPGPWTAWDDDGTGTLPCVLANQVTSFGNFYVAQCNVYEDARLIAAAPELLEECKMAIIALRQIGGHNAGVIASRLSDVVAKAEGK